MAQASYAGKGTLTYDEARSGNGYAFGSLNVEDIQSMRDMVLPIGNFITVKRATFVGDTEFRGILPPTVKNADLSTYWGACGKLEDPTCLTTYKMRNAMDYAYRKIDEISDPCDWNQLGNTLRGEYLALTGESWAWDELTTTMTYIDGELTETTVDPADVVNVRQLIEKMILEYLKISNSEMGRLGTKRRDLVVLVSGDIASAITESDLGCCQLADMTKGNTTNVWKVKRVVDMEFGYMPDGTQIMVYDPTKLFYWTFCEHNPDFSQMNQSGYKPNSIRFFAWENYAYDKLNWFNPSTPEDIVIVTTGIKYSTPTPPPPARATARTGANKGKGGNKGKNGKNNADNTQKPADLGQNDENPDDINNIDVTQPAGEQTPADGE